MKQTKLSFYWIDAAIIVAIFTIILFIPMLIAVAIGNSWLQAFFSLKYATPFLFTLVGGFLINYYYLIPRYSLQEKSPKKYILGCIISFLLLCLGSNQLGCYIFPDLIPPEGLFHIPKEINLAFSLLNLLMNILVIITAFSVRYSQRNRLLELQHAEQEKERAQNELQRLKGQLNPHFLFNTLNNISSLAAFDPDATQESISRLSDMLRYVLNDSSATLVPLKKDTEFMQNYMDLMQIRYEDTLQLKVNTQVSDEGWTIPPMLFISLLENAYKYGASSLHPCTIQLDLQADSEKLTFTIENTMLTPQEMASKTRGGLGLQNLQKRLELVYPERHSMKYHEDKGNNQFYAQIEIRK